MTKLEPPGGTLKDNLEQDPDWIDLGYDNGVITFITISTLLHEEWQEAQSEHIDWKNKFQIERVTKPGIYRDDEIHEDGNKNCYTIVVNHGFLCEKMVKEKISELNKKYDTDFKLSTD